MAFHKPLQHSLSLTTSLNIIHLNTCTLAPNSSLLIFSTFLLPLQVFSTLNENRPFMVHAPAPPILSATAPPEMLLHTDLPAKAQERGPPAPSTNICNTPNLIWPFSTACHSTSKATSGRMQFLLFLPQDTCLEHTSVSEPLPRPHFPHFCPKRHDYPRGGRGGGRRKAARQHFPPTPRCLTNPSHTKNNYSKLYFYTFALLKQWLLAETRAPLFCMPSRLSVVKFNCSFEDQTFISEINNWWVVLTS